MGISIKTKKDLWAKSGNRCAICKIKFSVNGVNVGEECHIVAKKEDGPRGKYPLDMNLRDDVSNLILLCANHHTEIDSKNNKYTVEKLRKIKLDHENYVDSSLDDNNFLEEQNLSSDKLTTFWSNLSKKSEFEFTLEQFEKCIYEYLDLDHKERKTIYSILKDYYKYGELNIPKIAKKLDDNKFILDSLIDSNFIKWTYTIELLKETSDGLIDYNEFPSTYASLKQFKDNWSFDYYGDILCELYRYLEKPNNSENFTSKLKLNTHEQ